MALRRALTVGGALLLVAAVSAPSYAQEKRTLSKDEIVQFQALHALVDAVSSGKQPAPADVKLTFHNYFLSAGVDVYVPYTIDIQPAFSKLPVGMYVRAVSKNPAPAAAAAPDRGGRGAPAGGRGGQGAAGGRGGRGRVGGAAPPSAVSYAFEDVSFYAAAADHVDRALELAPGDYDIYLAVSEPLPPPVDPTAKPDKKAAAATPVVPKSTVMVMPLTVPNLGAGSGLTTSSIILAKSIEPATSQPNGQQQLEQPYTISGLKIDPTYEAKFPKSGELLWAFYIYNEGTAATGKPDLQVEYNFYRGTEEAPFTHLAAAAFNATTLPAEFSIAAGHQVMAGTGVPLTTFAPGEYKMEVKIADKTNSQTVTRNVPFTVTP